MKKLLCLFALITPLVTTAIDAMEPTDSIVVELSTESRLLPLYLPHFWSEESAFSYEYTKKLEDILRFDLRYNGMTQALEVTSDRESRARKTAFQGVNNRSDWTQDGVLYIVKAQVTGRKIGARIVHLATGEVKGIQDIPLTGDFNSDRRQIHQLSDTLFKSLFNKNGVASTRLLYTVRTPSSSSQGPQWLSEVWECDWDGGNARQITNDGHYCVTPTYLPPKPGYKAGSFFYVSYRQGQPKIFYASIEGANQPRRLTRVRGNQLMPAVSKDRQQVAFITDATGNPDLFVQPFSAEAGALGKPFQVYATMRGTQASPTFSPDGGRIAFVSNKDGSPRIYVMPLPRPGARTQDLQPQMVSRLNRGNTAPAWSPDGTKLAYSAKTEEVRQIWIYDFATGKERQLTRGPGHKENPTWAPNSLHLVFNSADNSSSELFLVNLNQPEAVRITRGTGEKRFPAWEPRM